MSLAMAMKPQTNNVPDLSQRVSKLIGKIFAPAYQPLVRDGKTVPTERLAVRHAEVSAAQKQRQENQ